MPQSSGVPLPVRPIIDAGMPKNISAVDKAKLEAKWDAAAEARRVAVEHETATPTEPTRELKFKLRQYGRHWNACVLENNKWTEILPSPSLLSSAVDALYDVMLEQAAR